LHGWRHASVQAQDRVQRLKEGESLLVAIEINNPVASTAVQLQSVDDQMVLGWAPRYLADGRQDHRVAVVRTTDCNRYKPGRVDRTVRTGGGH
jgi:hypothetical protein